MQYSKASVGATIRNERERLGLTQIQLAARITVASGDVITMHPTALTRIERGIRNITLDEGVVIAAVLGITLDQLVGSRPIDPAERARQAEAERLYAVVHGRHGRRASRTPA